MRTTAVAFVSSAGKIVRVNGHCGAGTAGTTALPATAAISRVVTTRSLRLPPMMQEKGMGARRNLGLRRLAFGAFTFTDAETDEAVDLDVLTGLGARLRHELRNAHRAVAYGRL